MHMTGVLVRSTAGALLAISLLTGCGSSESEDPPEPEGVSSEELQQMHDALHDVRELIGEAETGSSTFQGVVAEVRAKNPAGAVDDPRVARALEEQQERERARDEAIAALGEMPAAADPDVAEAYDAFAAAAEDMFTFQSGYNASMAAFLHAMDICTQIFEVRVDDSDPLMNDPVHYEKAWHEDHDKRVRACQKVLGPVEESQNVNMQAIAEATRKVMTQRTQAVTEIGAYSAAKVKKANDAYIKRFEKLTAFSDELDRRSAIDEYDALHEVFAEKLELEESPSASPTSSPSASRTSSP